jgi:hypothetical protein
MNIFEKAHARKRESWRFTVAVYVCSILHSIHSLGTTSGCKEQSVGCVNIMCFHFSSEGTCGIDKNRGKLNDTIFLYSLCSVCSGGDYEDYSRCQ